MKKSMWKKLMSTILALVMVLGLSGTLGFQHVDATENSGFTFLPDKTEVKRGDIVTYSIDLAKNAKIAGITAQFTFDPDVLEAVGDGVDAKGYVKNAVKKGNVSEGTFGDFYVNTDGRIGIVAILNDNDKDKLADGNVAKISFKVKDTAKGDIGLKVKNLEFCDVNSEDIPTSEISVTKDNDAQIKVVVLATGITVDKTATTIVKGATDKLTATLVPADANGTITWTTSDSSVATVSSDGTVTAVKNGTATVTAKCGDLSAQTKVTVINPLKAITITGTTHSIKKGQTTQLGLTYDPADTTDSVAATWTSSNTSVATVSKTGLVTALKDGSTTIKATVGNVSSTYDIAVKEVKLTGIKMEEKALIHEGDTKALTVECTPTDTTDDKTVAWSSSDSTVASVDNNGIVTAVKPGSAVITAKVGNYQATCAVTVDAPLKEIVPEKAIIDMVKKQTANIAYSVVPADTTDSKDVTFTSSDETVATVNSDGKVTAKKAGKATVTITGANGIKATVTVNVSEIPVNEVVLSAQDEIIEAGAKKAITATLKPENNTDDNQGVTWTTSDEKIAKVIVDNENSHKATIEGVAAGSAVITATAANGTKAECTVKVPKHITSITLPGAVELTRGTSTTLNVTIAPADTDDDTEVTWKSSDSDVVKVDEKTGMVYAVKAGKADVTATTKAVDNATAKPFTATTTVTVKENNMTDEIGKKLAFDEFDDLLIGQKDNANKYFNLSDLIKENNITDNINVEFASSDKAVATIDNDGNVFGLKAGKTIITATVTAIAGDGSKNVYTAEGELTVKAIPLNSIAFDKVIKEMKLGATDTLSIIYNPQDTTDAKDVTWTSSNPNVISVENGKLTANAVGTADITAKVGDKTVTCTITVKEEKKAEQPKPVITNKKSDDKPAAKSVSKANDTKKAKTGDNNNVVLFLVMFAAAVAMIGVITGKSLRRNRR
ncbi:MAG: Ig-like domain-containing protein [[Eubacterium] rectale]|nr:Ig-like domain-containing protein [Agathobacter rectalis]